MTITTIFQRTWKELKRNAGYYALATLIIMALGWGTSSKNNITLQVTVNLLTLLVSPILLIEAYASAVENRKASISRAFSRFEWKYYGPYLLSVLYTVLGFICLIVPGVILSYSYQRVLPVVLRNDGKTAKEILRTSKEEMTGYRLNYFLATLIISSPVVILIAILSYLIVLAGLAMMGATTMSNVGVILALIISIIPLSFMLSMAGLAMYVAVNQYIDEQMDSDSEKISIDVTSTMQQEKIQ